VFAPAGNDLNGQIEIPGALVEPALRGSLGLVGGLAVKIEGGIKGGSCSAAVTVT
jgi:hypothetical protein